MKRILSALFLLCILLTLASCGYHQAGSVPEFYISDAVFTTERVTLCEAEDALGAPYALNKELEITEYNGTVYAFEPKVPMADREQCIRETEAILREIGTDRKIRINIYALGTYDSTFIEEGAVYTYQQNWKSPGYVSALLYGVFGEYCHYGTIFGYANYLCAELYDVPFEVCGDDWTYEGDQNALDLNLLCFRPEFVSGEDIQSVTQISNTFVSEYIETNGSSGLHELLEMSASPNTVNGFNSVLSDFHAANGIGHMPTELLYRLGGRGYDYIVKCEYATMYIEKNWFDANMDLCPYTYEGFLHQCYADTRQFFDINVKQMGQYQSLFGLESYDNDLDIYFSNARGNRSYYQAAPHAICLQNTGSFTHEYIHALTNKHLGFTSDYTIHKGWNSEGMAEYFCHKYDYYGNAMSSVDFNSLPEDRSRFRYVHEYREKLGRDIDMAVDFAELMHIATYAKNYDDPNDGRGYESGASFIGYLISRFGEEKVIEIICKTHDFGEFTYEELVADWQAFIQENYSGYSKVK